MTDATTTAGRRCATMRTARSRVLFVAAWIAVLGPSWDVGADEPRSARSAASDSVGPRELFKVFDIDEVFWSRFEDDRELSDVEHEGLLAVLFRLRRFPSASLGRVARPVDALARLEGNSTAARGDVFELRGRVTRVVREMLAPDERGRLEFEAIYRCEMTTDDGGHAIVYALAVPAAWKLDVSLDERS